MSKVESEFSPNLKFVYGSDVKTIHNLPADTLIKFKPAAGDVIVRGLQVDTLLDESTPNVGIYNPKTGGIRGESCGRWTTGHKKLSSTIKDSLVRSKYYGLWNEPTFLVLDPSIAEELPDINYKHQLESINYLFFETALSTGYANGICIASQNYLLPEKSQIFIPRKFNLTDDAVARAKFSGISAHWNEVKNYLKIIYAGSMSGK